MEILKVLPISFLVCLFAISIMLFVIDYRSTKKGEKHDSTGS